ncbi:MAG: hypothetical protein WCI00_05790 [bacterium]
MFQFAGHACHGFVLINSSALSFLTNSLLLLPSGSVTISLAFSIPSGEIINVHLALFPL